MSAKPQPMAGQSDAADDLIAELAKLMAQDAKGDRPAEPASPSFSVRIPGGESAAPVAPAPRFDFDRTVELTAEQPAVPAATPAPASPASSPVAPSLQSFDAPEPFRFDFGFDAPKPAPTAPRAVEQEPAPVEPALAAESVAEHDSIADLIAAEFSVPTETPPAAPESVAAPVVVASAPRPAPLHGPGWTPTAVAANLGAQEKSNRPALRALNLQPAPKSEQDRFSVPPVFGVGTKPAPVEQTIAPAVAAPVVPVAAEPPAPLRQPAPSIALAPAPAANADDGLGLDPIDEIESLIGRAMRVEFDKSVASPVEDRPALRTLAASAAPVAPVFAEPAPAPRALSGADEAIFAAAQATGAEIGWVDAPEVNELNDTPAARAPSRGRGITRAVAGPLVAVTLLLAAGFGLYWVLGLGRDTGPAPLLTAEATPTKETPVVQPDAAATQQSVVFNEIDGVVPGAEEQLVSRDQADVNEVTQTPPPAADLSEEGLANRKVRTVTVRPDGTIVSGEESVAGSAILPVDRPNVPAVPGAETASPELLASATAATDTTAAAPATDAVAVTPEPAVAATPAVTPVVPGTMVPAVDLAGAPLAGKSAPVPMLRPAGLLQSSAPLVTDAAPVTAVVAPSASGGNFLPPPPTTSTLGALPTAAPVTAAVEPVAAAQPAAAVAIPGAVEVDALPNSAAAYAQLASLRTEEEARQAAQSLVNRFGPLFGGANMEVQRVDLGARGIYYRVRVPASSAAEAGNICTNVIAAGGDCVLM